MSRLHLLSGESIAASIELTGDLITIGRTENNAVCIEDKSISETHGILVRDGDDYQIHDFNSTNGTRVNGEKIMAVKLKHGDHVHIGLVELAYESTAAPPVPAGPKIKLGVGAKQLSSAPTTPKPTPAAPERKLDEKLNPLSSAETKAVTVPPLAKPTLGGPPVPPPAKAKPETKPTATPPPLKRTLGGQPITASTPTPTPPPPPPAKPKKEEERVFIRLPDSGAATPPKPPTPPLPPPPPEPVAPPPPPPAAIPVEEAEQPMAATPAPPAEDRPLASPTTAPRGEVSLRAGTPPATGERKISLKPQQAPREKLHFGPKKKG